MKALVETLNRELAKLPNLDNGLPATLAGMPVTYLGEGIHRVTYLLGDKLVLKFPQPDYDEDQESANLANVTEYVLSTLFRKIGLLDYFAESYGILTGYSRGPVLIAEYLNQEVDPNIVSDWDGLCIEDSYLNDLADKLEPLDIYLEDIHSANVKGTKVIDYGSFSLPRELATTAHRLLRRWAA